MRDFINGILSLFGKTARLPERKKSAGEIDAGRVFRYGTDPSTFAMTFAGIMGEDDDLTLSHLLVLYTNHSDFVSAETMLNEIRQNVNDGDFENGFKELGRFTVAILPEQFSGQSELVCRAVHSEIEKAKHEE